MLKDYSLLQQSMEQPASLKNLLKNKESLKSHLFIPLFEEFKKPCGRIFPFILFHKKNQGFFTMDDMEILFKDLIEQNKEILQLIATSWDYWFIDEYQGH